MKISTELAENILLDWKKRNISAEEKSLFIKGMLKEHGISQRELGRRLNISHSTIQDWVTMRQKEKYVKYNSVSNIFSLADRLIFLLSKNNDIDDKTRDKLRLLENEIRKVNI